MIYENFILMGQMLERRATAVCSTISGLSYSETRLLSALMSGPLTRADLAAAVQLTPSAVSRALQPLEKLGFVISARDGRDARQARAQITPAGQERLGDALAGLQDAWTSLELDFGAISAHDVASVLGQLQQPRPLHKGNRPDWAQRTDPAPLPIPSRPGIKIS